MLGMPRELEIAIDLDSSVWISSLFFYGNERPVEGKAPK